MNGGLLFTSTIDGVWEVAVLDQSPNALVLIANAKGELVHAEEITMMYAPRFGIDVADLNAVQTAALNWIDAAMSLTPKNDWPGINEAIEHSTNIRYVCLGLTALYCGWDTQDRVQWLLTAPLWPIIIEGNVVDG